MSNPLAVENADGADPQDTPGCFRFEGAWWVCAQYPATQEDKIALPPGGFAALGGAPWKTTSAVTEMDGAACLLSLVGAPRPYISGLVDVLQTYQREIRGGDYIWLNKRWDDDEPPVLRVRRVRRRPELGVAEEIARQSGAYFLRPSTNDQLRAALGSVLGFPQASTWDDVESRLSERGDTRLAFLVRNYVNSGFDAGFVLKPEPAPDEEKKTTSTPNVMDFLQMVKGHRA